MKQPLEYLDELDALLLDRSDDAMLLSELDGFLTGIIVCPDLITPSAWIKRVWAGEDGQNPPQFPDTDALQHFLDLVMRHYNEILFSLDRPGGFEPIFEIDARNGDILWELWIDGFNSAMKLNPKAWNRIRVSADDGAKAAVAGVAMLAEINEGRANLSGAEEDKWEREAPSLIPIWVQLLHEWRLENDPGQPDAARRGKVGRNDPCPCGSGKKYKKCCGLN